MPYIEPPITFELTTDHVTLLRALYVDDDAGPQIDRKRPYGDSDVQRSILEALGEAPMLENRHGERDYSKAQGDRAIALDKQMPAALQIMLACGAVVTGKYRKGSPYVHDSWELEIAKGGAAADLWSAIEDAIVAYAAQRESERCGDFCSDEDLAAVNVDTHNYDVARGRLAEAFERVTGVNPDRSHL